MNTPPSAFQTPAFGSSGGGGGGGASWGSITGTITDQTDLVAYAARLTGTNSFTGAQTFDTSLRALSSGIGYSFTGQTDSGIANVGGNIAFHAGGALAYYMGRDSSGFGIHRDYYLGWSDGSSSASGTKDTFIRRGGAAATVQLGNNHATTATHQTFKAHNVTTGTGANLILSGGTGSVADGVVIISALPTANPGPGILWNNAGTPAIGT